ncbi:MAG: hypothetical protein ACQEP7_06635 [bacterium]
MDKYKLFIFFLIIITTSIISIPAAGSFNSLTSRQDIYLNLENPEGTLAFEKRTLTLSRGMNEINFSWQNVKIDPASIRLKFLEQENNAELTGINYLDNNTLTWEIYSESPQQVKAGIYYLLEGFQRNISYQLINNSAENSLQLKEEQTVFNHSGENFNNPLIGLGHGFRVRRRLQDGQTRRLPVYRSDTLPVDRYVFYDAQKHEPQTNEKDRVYPVKFRLTNLQEQGLGDKPLYEGKVRIYENNTDDQQIFTGEDHLPYTPREDTTSLTAGMSQDIQIDREKTESERLDIVRDDRGNIQLYDLIETVELAVESFKEDTRSIILQDNINGEWEMLRTSHSYKKIDHQTIRFKTELEPGEEKKIVFRYRRKNIRGDYR